MATHLILVGVLIFIISIVQVVSDLPFLHPSEVEILNHLCKLGSHFKQFELFIKNYSVLLPEKSTNNIENDVGKLM